MPSTTEFGAELFRHYPALREHLDRLARGATWSLTGVSALLCDDQSHYLELTKPKHWRRLDDGTTLVGLGALGGSLEAGESVLGCLRRELLEEAGVEAEVLGAGRTAAVYEERDVTWVAPPPASHPLPALLTVSRNLNRRGDLPGSEILAIVTFWARPLSSPRRGDLYGLARVPAYTLERVLRAGTVTAPALAALPGVEIETAEPLPAEARLAPVWTMRSVQVLAERNVLLQPPAGLRPAGG